MRVKMSRCFPVESIVKVSLEFATGTPKLLFQSRIIRQIDDDCMGLEFEGMTPPESRKLEEFLLPRILQMAETRKAHQLG
jgi:hypothetical protein